MKLVECVPNFSEGRDDKVINQIADTIKQINGVSLLDVDPGQDTNRTVFTFVGSPDEVVEAAFQAIKVGMDIIDMSQHSGAHPRMGACDVCPFVPVSEMDMDECIELANKLGKRLGDELGLPIYLYEYAAKNPERKNLANIRTGEYEALSEKLGKKEWKPDFGPNNYNTTVKKSGATAVGAREFLIAYNIDLNSKNKALANKIAKRIREKGRKVKDKETGEKVQIPGRLKECKAIGWYVEDYKRAQISINLTNYNVTNMHQAYDAACEEAEKIGVRITGSEIVGLVPKAAMIEAGLHYLKKANQSRAVSEEDLIDIATYSLGLNDCTKFIPNEKIIEYKIKRDGLLTDFDLIEFTDELASKSPAPGGGSVAALSGSIASSLCSMVGNLTFKKKKYKKVWEEVEELSYNAHNLKKEFLDLINKDTDAFNILMAAMKMPKKTDSDKEKRNGAMLEATKKAILVPFQMMQLSEKAYPIIERMSEIGNTNALSDIAVSTLLLESALKGAFYNILINFKDFEDKDFENDIMGKANKINNEVSKKILNLRSKLEKKLSE